MSSCQSFFKNKNTFGGTPKFALPVSITAGNYSLGYPNATKVEQFEIEAADYSLSYPNATKFNIEIAE